MKSETIMTAEFLETFTVSISDPLSVFLLGTEKENKFTLSLLDVVRFAGHACTAMIGAFLITRAAIENLYPDTKTCIRGDVEIDIPDGATDGSTGPMANVLSYITGAWSDTGFGGFKGGDHVRRNLLRFNSKNTQSGAFRFTRKDTGASVDIIYQPQLVKLDLDPTMPFPLQLRHKVKAVLENPEAVIKVIHLEKN